MFHSSKDFNNMDKPIAEGKNVKSAAIYQATLEICQSRGIGNASTAEISQRAGIATGTLFYYYATKEQLFNAIYKKIIVAVTDFAHQGLLAIPEYNHERLLRQLWQCYVSWFKKHPLETNYLNMLNVHNGFSPYISRETVEELLECYAEAKRLFQSAVEKEVLKPLPPMLLLRVFIANATTVASLYHNRGSLSAFLDDSPQVLNELENGSWDMIARKAGKK